MNWGNRLLITFGVFGTGMCYLVYRSMHTNFELVEKDYYKTELKYQHVIDASNRVSKLSSGVKYEETASGVILQLPSEMQNRKIDGEVWFYCPYNSGNDRRFNLQVDNNGSQVILKKVISPGAYTVKTAWTADGQEYYSENRLTVIK